MRSRADKKYDMTDWLIGRVKCTNFIRKALSPISYICCYKIVAHSKEKNALRYCLPPLKGRLAAEDVPALFLITNRYTSPYNSRVNCCLNT